MRLIEATAILITLTVVSERLLLHTETASGSVVPLWEDVTREEILDVREVMNNQRHSSIDLNYVRIPITAERAPGETET